MMLAPLLLALVLSPAQADDDSAIPLDAPYASAFDDDSREAEGADDTSPTDAPADDGAGDDNGEIPLDAPYESAFDEGGGDDGADEGQDIGLDEPYVSPFDPKPVKPKVDPKPDDELPNGDKPLELESVVFDNRVYFRESTIRGFVGHPVPGRLDVAQLNLDAETLQAKYKSRGFLAARVTAEVRPGKNPYGRVGAFVIEAGDRAPLNKVRIVGNRHVDDLTLRNGFFSRPPEPLGWVTRAAFYHKPFVDQDVQRLLANYYARGFLEARVAEHRVEAQPDLDGLELVFQVVEGPVYELISLELSGDLPEGQTAALLRQRVGVRDGAVCDLIKIQQDADAILDDLREVGYPFARVEQAVEIGPPPSGDVDRRGIGLKLKLVKGQKATVREIRVSGNQGLLYGTLDRVILRDVLLDPGDEYQHSLLKLSQQRLMGLGYFSQVEIKPVPTDDPALVDIEVKVAEQPTWLLNLAPAYVGNEGFILIGIAADRHVLGSGLSVSLIGTLSFQRQVFDFSVAEPRLFDTRIGVTGEAHRRLIAYQDYRIGSEFGGGVSVRFPVAPLSWGLFLGGSATSEFGGVVPYTENEVAVPIETPANDLFPQKVFRNVGQATATWDLRDNLLSPRNGVFATASVSYAGRYSGSGFGIPLQSIEDGIGVDVPFIDPYLEGGDGSALDFLKAEGNLRLFFSPFWNITFKTNTRVGVAFNPHGGDVPVTDRFFLGGFGSIRGYFPRSIGPTRQGPKTDGQPIRVGGVHMFAQNTEIEFPLWPETPFRGFLFADAGNTFDEGELFGMVNPSDPIGTFLGAGLDRGTPILPVGLFWSVGFGLLIQTPVLPLRFEWSVPLTRRKTEATRPIDFFFGIGSAF
jgi:outer membrane protein insertion porin family